MTSDPAEVQSFTPPNDREPSGQRGGLRRRLLSGGLWVVGARVIGMSSTVLANVLIARRLAPGDFGDFVLVCSIASAASLFAMFGLNSAVVRFVAEQLAKADPPGARHVLQLCFRLAAYSTSTTALAVLTGIYCFTGPFLHLAHPGRIALLTAMAVAFQAFCNLSAAALRGLGEMRYSSLLGGQGGVVGPLANTLFLVAIAGLAAIWQLSLSGTLAAYVCCFGAVMAMGGVWLVRTASAVLGTRASNRQALSAPPLRATTLLVTCCPMLLVQVLAVIAKQGGLWVAGGSCPADELALYAGANRAIQLVSIPLSLVNLSVMAFIPQLRTEGRLPELQQILRISAGWAAIPSFLALLAFVIAPAPILEVFLGPFYRQAAVLLSILSLGQFILVWVGSSELTLVLSGHARTAAVVNATTACTLVIGGPLVARQFGVVGLAVLAALVIGSQSLAQWLLARRLVGVWTHATLCPWRKMNSIR